MPNLRYRHEKDYAKKIGVGLDWIYDEIPSEYLEEYVKLFREAGWIVEYKRKTSNWETWGEKWG